MRCGLRTIRAPANAESGHYLTGGAMRRESLPIFGIETAW